jgi:predicted RNase H-like nuclease (RuvC/YqgF family)
MSDHIQALIDEMPGIATGDKVGFFSIMKAQAQHKKSIIIAARLRTMVEQQEAKTKALEAWVEYLETENAALLCKLRETMAKRDELAKELASYE